MPRNLDNPLSRAIRGFARKLLQIANDTSPDDNSIKEEDIYVQRRQQLELESNLARQESAAMRSDLQDQWFRRLSQMAQQFRADAQAEFVQRGDHYHLAAVSKGTMSLFEELYGRFNDIGTRFNIMCQTLDNTRVRVAVSDLDQSRTRQTEWMAHFHVATTTRRLSAVCKPGLIQLFLTPSSISIGTNEPLSRDQLKLSIELGSMGKERIWTVYSLPLSESEIDYLMRVSFRDLILMSSSDVALEETGNKFESVENLNRIDGDAKYRDGLSLNTEPTEDLVRDLIFAQQNIVHKLLNQQEEIQADIARELHDSVLADILMLARRIASETSVDDEEIKNVLEKCGATIREICRGLVPRDLKDWGLETVVQDLVDKLAERTEADCSLEVEGHLPELPPTVQLHIFRIVQECLNNIEKYAEAKNVFVTMTVKDQLFRIIIDDDGVGFDRKQSRSTGEGGFGLPGLEERVEIIRAFYPTRFKVESGHLKGTKITLELHTPVFRR
ncbi:MAG: hypothetical protein K2Z81_23390 [Cyanobacteria bacterium]|nr:hypothetical protein [Cyanobacteriota bacterium]